LALAWLLYDQGINPDKITVFTERDIPEIEYSFKRQVRKYRPDIKVGSTLVEVKSIWTLLHQFDLNKAKAKACVEQGLRHRTLICSPGKVSRLPSEWLTWKPKKVEEWWSRQTAQPVVVLAMDPGVNSFGWSALRVQAPGKIEVLGTGMLRNTIRDLTLDVLSQTQLMVDEVKALVESYHVRAFALERFQSRGLGGTTIERVNIMVGILFSLALNTSQLKTLLIPASQWKNEFNRHNDLEALYSDAPSCTPHQLDATGIGIYSSYYWFGEKPFQGFSVQARKKAARQAAQVNTHHEMVKIRKGRK
jgi:hypothetical protein